MGTPCRLLIALLALVLTSACHGPPIMSRITPRYASNVRYASEVRQAAERPAERAGRGANVLRAPFLSREGKPNEIVTEEMIDHIERAVRRRQKPKPLSTEPHDIGEVMRRYRPGKVGRQERGCIPIPVSTLLKKLLGTK